MKPKLVPVLSISTNATGTHRTIYPVGTKADMLYHDIDPTTGEPTYAEGVYVEMISTKLAAEVRERGKISFSDMTEFYKWLLHTRR